MERGITQQELMSKLLYVSETGQFFWKKAPSVFGGKIREVGCVKDNYRVIKVNFKMYYAHRLVWLYVHGEFPKHEIDHINRNGLDNRVENLRPATRNENAGNQGIIKPNVSGARGVRYEADRNKYLVRIKNKHVGRYKTLEEATRAYARAAREVYGEFFDESGAVKDVACPR